MADLGPELGPAPEYQLACLRCDWRSDPEFLLRCPKCDGALDADIALEDADLRPGDHPEEIYLGFLPVRSPEFCDREFAADHRIITSDRVSLTVVDGDYAGARLVALDFAARHGLAREGGFFNWARREGLKIGYPEAFDAMDAGPEVVVQAISSGMGVLTARKGAREYLSPVRPGSMPRFLTVPQDTCAPKASAWNLGRAELTDADARDVYPYMLDIAVDTGGSVASVRQDEMVEARRMLRELEDLDVCYASAATVAAARHEAAAGRISPDQVVLLTLTGCAHI